MKKLLNKKRSESLLLNLNLKMKITLLFIFTSVFALQAHNSYSQKTLVSLDMENIRVENILDAIEKTTDLKFTYKTEDVDLERRINLKVRKEPIQKVLERIFKDSQTSYNILDTQVFLVKKPSVSTSPVMNKTEDEKISQQSRITGLITDETGLTFPGVYVIIKGTAQGTITNMEGNYSIPAQPTDTLLFSHIGYRTIEMAVGLRERIDLQMIPEQSQLSEVIITGIYERKADSYTGSTTTITSEQLRKKGNANLFQAIQNIDPSIVIMDNFDFGSNPNTLPNMQIRGTSTFPTQDGGIGGDLRGNYLRDPNSPLFILNGFEVTVEQVYDLDINRIEKISVLKDAASKALYGSRAANGVVVIETTKLTAGEALISYNTSLDLEIPDLTSYDLTNSLEKLEAELIDGLYTPTYNDPESYIQLRQLYNSRRRLALEGLDTDWMAKPLQNGVGHRHSLSVELGEKDLRVQANLTYRDIEGAMIGSSRENIDGSLTALYRIKNFSFSNNMRVNNVNEEESPYGQFSEYTRMNPYWRAENLNGTIPYYAEVGPNGSTFTNPLFNSTLNSRLESSYLNFINNFYLEWRFLPDFKVTTRVGLNVKKSDANEFYPSDHTRFENYFGQDVDRKGSYQLNNGESNYVHGDINLQYNKTIQKHFYFANLGFNVSENKFNEVIHRAEGFPSSRMDDIIFARNYALDSRPIGVAGINRELGFLAVGSYVWDDRFLSDATFRTSASSQFGADRRWANFWSVGLGWNLHNETLFEGLNLNQLKLRGSVGSTGNQNFNTNESIATYSYYLDSRYQGFPGSLVQNLSNPFLQWETKMDYNAGIDTRLGGLTLRFDYYESYTENLIADITVPFSTGFNSVKENLGKVKNSGIELDLNYNLWSQGKNFFAVNFGIATNHNEIVELSNAMRTYNEAMEQQAADQENSRPVLRYVDGMSMNAIWAVPSLGIDPATGNEVYLDRNGNTTYEWNAQDMIVAGNSNPKYRGIFGISGEYKGIGISLTGRYLGGGQIYNQTLVDRVENVDMNYNVDRRVLTGRWLYPGQEALFKRLGQVSVDSDGDGVLDRHFTGRTRATSRFVQDRDELSIAAINVYYEFPKPVLDLVRLNRLRFSFNMNEIATFSTVKIERGLSYPFARNLSFSLMANL